jgi:uncharacterized membrane protein
MKTLTTSFVLGASLAFAAFGAAAQVPHEHGPSLPPALRGAASSTPPASGEQLRKQAMQKLRQRFEAADLDASGRLTRAEAERAGLGFVSQRFDEFDGARSGAVSFDDVSKVLRARTREK